MYHSRCADVPAALTHQETQGQGKDWGYSVSGGVVALSVERRTSDHEVVVSIPSRESLCNNLGIGARGHGQGGGLHPLEML